MSNNIRRVAKNTAALYLRASASLIIQLVAVKYLLRYLGEESYGLYGLIGSIVLIAESLRGVFSTSLQRFINVESGKKDISRLRDIFNVGLRLITIVAISSILVVIIGGLIAIPYLNIPSELHHAAYIILIFSTLTLGVNLITTVYDAVLIAYEKFNYVAFLSIGQSILKFASVLVLIFFSSERVEWYSLFIFLTSFITLIICIYLCKKYYRNIISFSPVLDKKLYKEIGSFTGYKVVGSTCTSIQNAGINVLLNIFGNLMVNTARTISYQIISAVNILVWNIVTGFSPRCISLYGEGNYHEFSKMLYLMTKTTLTINIILGFTVSVFACPILNIWLGYIPPYTPWFIRIIFIYYIVRAIQDGLDLLFTATGNIKEFQYTISLTQMASIIIGGITLWLGFSYYSVFLVMVILECFCVLIGLYYSNKKFHLNILYFSKIILIPLAISLVILGAIFTLTYNYISAISSLPLIMLLVIIYLFFSGLLTIYIFFGKNAIRLLIKKALHFI